MVRSMRTGWLCLVGVLYGCGGGADADPESPTCCTDASCAATAQTCNTTSCACENIACARPAGEPELCPAGAFCRFDDGVTGLCTSSECQDFFTGACGAELGCRPQSSDAYACEPVGEGGVDEPCLGDVDCAYGLLCADERCLEPDCSAVSDVAPCVGADQICRAIVRNGESLDVGLCVEPCTAFYGGGCTGGAWCWPDRRNGETHRLDGHCVTDAGALPVDGSRTSHRDCDADLGCFGPPGRERCRALCDWQAVPGAPGSCEAGAECLPLLRPSGSARDYGYCTDGCRAFLAGECPVGDWCFPELRNNLTGGLEGSCLPGGGSVAQGGARARLDLESVGTT